jgi:hypothetical protein
LRKRFQRGENSTAEAVSRRLRIRLRGLFHEESPSVTDAMAANNTVERAVAQGTPARIRIICFPLIGRNFKLNAESNSPPRFFD